MLKRRSVRSGWSVMGLVTLFWVLMAVVSTFQTYYFYSMMPSSIPPYRAVYLASVYSILWALATPLVFLFARVFPIERQNLLSNLPLHVVLSIVVGFGHRLIWIGLQITIPALHLGKPITWQRAVSDLVTSIDYQAMVYWVLLAIHQGALYYRKYQEGRLRSATLETQLAQAQLSGLRMQLQPHFLFNTLSTINALMFESPERASEMIVRLSEFLRISLENTGLQEVPLDRELDFIERYLEIERTRFEERLRVEYRIEAGALNLLVPNLLLQPLVENAIKHGISQLTRGGTLRISANERNGSLRIFVANSGSFLSSELLKGTGAKSTGLPPLLGIGLSNTIARLRALYGEGHVFELRNWHEGGVEAFVSIPARPAPPQPDSPSIDSRQWQGVKWPYESANSG